MKVVQYTTKYGRFDGFDENNDIMPERSMRFELLGLPIQNSHNMSWNMGVSTPRKGLKVFLLSLHPGKNRAAHYSNDFMEKVQ